jgi:hypothetical protein
LAHTHSSWLLLSPRDTYLTTVVVHHTKSNRSALIPTLFSCSLAPPPSLPLHLTPPKWHPGSQVWQLEGVDPASKPRDPVYSAVVRDPSGYCRLIYRANNSCKPSNVKRGRFYRMSGTMSIHMSGYYPAEIGKEGARKEGGSVRKVRKCMSGGREQTPCIYAMVSRVECRQLSDCQAPVTGTFRLLAAAVLPQDPGSRSNVRGRC